jgi:hypothetical protein
MPYLPWLIGLLITVVVVERVKVLARKREGAEQGQLPRAFALANRVTPPIYLIALLCIVIGILVDRTLLLQRHLEKAKEDRVAQYESVGITSIFGEPPRPVRPNHETRLGGTYYRGNNERNTALYNNGNYRTATLELSLVDGTGNKLDYGEPVSGELSIRLLIRSAPGATPALFNDEIMDGLVLATGYHPQGMMIFSGDVGTFEATDQPNEWQAIFPIKKASADLQGLVYLYRGKQDESGNTLTSGTPQIGIVYDLILDEGRIATGSELWLDAIYFPENVAPPPKDGKLPWTEWFDFRPIPVIKGDNTKDPSLLGITGDAQGDLQEP